MVRTRSCAEWSGFCANNSVTLEMATSLLALVYSPVRDRAGMVTFRLSLIPSFSSLLRRKFYFQDGKVDEELQCP